MLLLIGGELDYLEEPIVFSSITKSFYVREWIDRIFNDNNFNNFHQKRIDSFY